MLPLPPYRDFFFAPQDSVLVKIGSLLGQRLFIVILGLTLFSCLIALLWSWGVRANSWLIQDIYYTVTAFLIFVLCCLFYMSTPFRATRVLNPEARVRGAHFFVDHLSLLFVVLTAYIIFFCFCYALRWSGYHSRNFLAALLFGIEFLLFVVFMTCDVLFFYIAYELSLLPVIFMILKWGTRRRRYKAAYYMLLYTVLGSVPFLVGVCFALAFFGSTIFLDWTVPLLVFPHAAAVLWWLFIFAFLVKIPIVPLHGWLPEAHVEAPTIGSIVLAGLLLKMGIYGLVRFHVLIFQSPVWPSSWGPALLVALGSLNIVFGGLLCIRQIDLKKLIAYSSICHVGMTVLALFGALNRFAFDGALLSIFSHAFVASGLFALAGCLHDRCGTRVLQNFMGLAPQMTWWVVYFFLLTLANMSFPGSLGFLAEYFMLTGLAAPWSDVFILVVFAFGVFSVTVYSIVAFSRIAFGQLDLARVDDYVDLDWREHVLALLMIVPLIWYGVRCGSFDQWLSRIPYITKAP